MDTQLSQEEIDRLFRKHGGVDESELQLHTAITYDFRRPDRIPKEQLRSIHLMHDFLSRNLASSLGAYLRAYVNVSLVSVEQLSFGEFLQYLPTPTCISSIGMRPMDGNSVLEINPSLVFPMLNILLGGSEVGQPSEVRELTEIEQSIVGGLLRVILHDLKETWSPVAEINFSVEEIETQPQLMQILSPNEAIVAIGFEIIMGEARGMLNFGMPSIMVKMMGQKFEQQWSIRRRTGTSTEKYRMAAIVRKIPVVAETRIWGTKITVRELVGLQAGDVLSLEVPVRRPSELLVNGRPKFLGEVVTVGNQRGMVVQGPSPAADDSKESG
jgi:flagellar motor switch protein FliM